jgi:signal transduction histidine kinase
MAGMVFRQLDHPIRRIESELENIEADLSVGIDTPDDLAHLRTSAKHALESVQLLRQTIKKVDPLAVDRRVIRPEKTTLRKVVGGVVAAYEEECDAAGVFLQTKLPRGIEIRTLVPVFQNALSNILDNAIYWASIDGRNHATPIVRVEIDKTRCRILNNGPRIPVGDLKAIFEPHFTTLPDRHGLGLTLSRDLMESIGGQVKARNLKGWVQFEVVAAGR